MAPLVGRQTEKKRFLSFRITARGETWRSPLHNITSNDIHSVYLTYIVTHRKHSCIDSRKKKTVDLCVCASERALITAQSPTDFARGKCAWCVCAFPRRTTHVGEFNDLDAAPTKEKNYITFSFGFSCCGSEVGNGNNLSRLPLLLSNWSYALSRTYTPTHRHQRTESFRRTFFFWSFLSWGEWTLTRLRLYS